MSYSEDEELEPESESMLLGRRAKVDGVDSYVIYSPTETSTGLFNLGSEFDSSRDRYLSIEEQYTVKLENNR